MPKSPNTFGNRLVSFLACFFLFHNVFCQSLFEEAKFMSLNHLDRLGTSINKGKGNIDEDCYKIR